MSMNLSSATDQAYDGLFMAADPGSPATIASSGGYIDTTGTGGIITEEDKF